MLPNPCHTLRTEGKRTGRDLLVRLIAEETPTTGGGVRGCADVLVPVAYSAAVRDLAPATYHLRVTYALGESADSPQILLEEEITVRS